VLEQFPQKLQSSVFVPTLLHQHIEDFAFIVHGAPEPHLLSADRDIHLVQMPPAGRSATAPAQVGGNQRSELQRPASDRLVADLASSLSQQLLDVAKAQREPVVEPDRLPITSAGNR
jgi:hypothetical protein